MWHNWTLRKLFNNGNYITADSYVISSRVTLSFLKLSSRSQILWALFTGLQSCSFQTGECEDRELPGSIGEIQGESVSYHASLACEIVVHMYCMHAIDRFFYK
jgi:hypothetical protein